LIGSGLELVAAALELVGKPLARFAASHAWPLMMLWARLRFDSSLDLLSSFVDHAVKGRLDGLAEVAVFAASAVSDLDLQRAISYISWAMAAATQPTATLGMPS
jgi:hypothetical protein